MAASCPRPSWVSGSLHLTAYPYPTKQQSSVSTARKCQPFFQLGQRQGDAIHMFLLLKSASNLHRSYMPWNLALACQGSGIRGAKTIAMAKCTQASLGSRATVAGLLTILLTMLFRASTCFDMLLPASTCCYESAAMCPSSMTFYDVMPSYTLQAST